MHGVDKLYLLNAVSPDELTQGLIAYDLAKKLRLKHIVYHSVFRVEHFKDVPHFASKLAMESAIREFEVPFTIIRPNYFIQNDATLKDPLLKTGIYAAPLGNVGISVAVSYTHLDVYKRQEKNNTRSETSVAPVIGSSFFMLRVRQSDYQLLAELLGYALSKTPN